MSPELHALLCFASTFVAVFALGLQSLNVNQGHYLAAAATSVLISAGHVGLYKFMPEADLLQMAGYFAGGIVGITSSMWFHRTARAWWKRTSSRREALIGDARAWPGNFWRACIEDLERWYQAELERLNWPDPQPIAQPIRCTRCFDDDILFQGDVVCCMAVDCPFKEALRTDVH